MSTALKPYTVFDPIQAMKTVPTKVPCLVEGLIPLVGLSMLTAKPKSGKSTFLRQLCVSVAEGRPFLGLPVVPGNALYLNLEGSDGNMLRHFQTLELTNSPAGQVQCLSGFLETGEARFRKLLATLATFQNLRLVVIDPVSNFLFAPDENDASVVRPLLKKLEFIARERKTQIVFARHAKKRETDDPGDSSMGSTAFRGATDTNLFLKRKGLQRILCTEQRENLPWMEPTFLNFDPERQEFSLGQTVESAEESARERQKRFTTERMDAEILAALCTGPLATDELLHRVQGADTRKYERLTELRKVGRICCDTVGKKILYSIAAIPTEQKEAA